jgi:hypothetical protein
LSNKVTAPSEKGTADTAALAASALGTGRRRSMRSGRGELGHVACFGSMSTFDRRDQARREAPFDAS